MLRKLMYPVVTTILISTVISLLSTAVMAAPPSPQFSGQVSEIFVNDSQVLLIVSGKVNGSCTGTFGSYNLTFDLNDGAASNKFTLINEALQKGQTIAGYVNGCGSSNINKLSQVSLAK